MKKVNYYSSDKLYQVPVRKKLKIKAWLILLVVPSIIFILLGGFLLSKSITINGKIQNVGYAENGNSNYKVYLKENQFEDAEFIEGGKDKKFVASLINFINAKFNYEIHADKNLDFDYKYKIIGDLIINDRSDGKELHRKTYTLKEETKKQSSSNNLVINEDVDIKYSLYNEYANAYKRDLALMTDSKLVVKMQIEILGNVGADENLEKTNELAITIPLSEQTIDIEVSTDDFSNSGILTSKIGTRVENPILLTVSSIVILIGFILLGYSLYIFIKYRKKNIYQIKVNKLLKEYDRLIVVGGMDINEIQYKNKVYPESFEEMVDAAETLQKPILFYEVIPDEKCFFVILGDNTIYKYRLTRAYLEKEQQLSCEKKLEDA